jgi:hypothetical protein
MKEVVTEIQLQASPERVWEVLAANEDWEAWNPFITKSVGALVVGQRVSNTMAMKGRAPMTFKPRILKAQQAQELRWLGRLVVPGLFDGEHYFKLEASGDGTRFVQGEIFRGLLIGMMNFDDVRASFVALNEALKKRVESA